MSINSRLHEFIHRRYNISFSKSGDDVQLMKLLNAGTPGTYVDVGCWHPTRASNTYYFYLRGWRGICIDPNPELAPLYAEVRPRDTFVNGAVGEAAESLTYYLLDDACSSMNTFDLDFLRREGVEDRIKRTLSIPMTPLAAILDRHVMPGERLDFFDIDVEGLDLAVLRTNDWNRHRPRVVVVETHLPLKEDLTSDIVQYLEGQDYRLVGKSVISGDLGNLFLTDCCAVELSHPVDA